MSIECQSNNPEAGETVSAPTLQSVSSTGASIGATFSNRDEFEPVGINYYVQYGTQYARYTDQSPTQTATLSRSGSATKSMVLSGLQPATTYHYRVVLVGHEVEYGTSTNYSGAHQTFITAASVGAPSGVPPRVAGAPVIRKASAGNRSARVAFTPPKTGSRPITGYRVTVFDITAGSVHRVTTGSTRSPISVPGLTNGDRDIFPVSGLNAAGSGRSSDISNVVTPPGSMSR